MTSLTEVSRLARKRGVVGMLVAVVSVTAGVLCLIAGSGVGFLVAGGIAFVALGLVIVVVSGIALTIARSFPAVRHLGGINDFLRLLALVVAVAGGLSIGLLDFSMNGIVLAISLVVVGVSGTLLAGANRAALRDPAAVLPAKG